MLQIDPVLGWMAAAAAAAIFAASGALKFYDLEAFRGAVTNYRLIPEWLGTPFAWTAPVVESAAALGLLLSPIRSSAALVLIVLLGVFTGAIAINLARRPHGYRLRMFRGGAATAPQLVAAPAQWCAVCVARDRPAADGRAADGISRPRHGRHGGGDDGGALYRRQLSNRERPRASRAGCAKCLKPW